MVCKYFLALLLCDGADGCRHLGGTSLPSLPKTLTLSALSEAPSALLIFETLGSEQTQKEVFLFSHILLPKSPYTPETTGRAVKPASVKLQCTEWAMGHIYKCGQGVFMNHLKQATDSESGLWAHLPPCTSIPSFFTCPRKRRTLLFFFF